MFAEIHFSCKKIKMIKLLFKNLIFTLIIVHLAGCGTSDNVETPSIKKEDKQLANGHFIINAQIVQHHFESKNGKVSEFKEYYVRRSVQDYFIKFCEGGVTVVEIEKALKKQKGEIKTLTLEIEKKDGMWDSCDSENLVQSRTGEYIVIHHIIP